MWHKALLKRYGSFGAFELQSSFQAKFNMKSQLKYNKKKCSSRSWKMRENVSECESKMKRNISYLGMNYISVCLGAQDTVSY